MKIVIHANQIEWQQRWSKYIINGLKKHNILATVTPSSYPVPCDIAILMGPNAWQDIERGNKPYLMFNRKFVGNDPKIVHENCAISWNGFNGDGTFCVGEVDPSRLERYINSEEDIKPWNHNGKHLLLCEQTNVGRSKKFRSISQFYDYVKNNAQDPIVFRKKPIGEEQIDARVVQQQLSSAKAVVHLNSTISIDAMMAGVPVISLDVGDPAYAITSHDINEIIYPDRLPLLRYLASCQWHHSEVESGEFWNHIYPISGKKLHEWDDNGS